MESDKKKRRQDSSALSSAVELHTFNVDVGGSNPPGQTKQNQIMNTKLISLKKESWIANIIRCLNTTRKDAEALYNKIQPFKN